MTNHRRHRFILTIMAALLVSPVVNAADFLSNPTSVNIASCGSGGSRLHAQNYGTTTFILTNCGTTNAMYRSTDNGATWTTVRSLTGSTGSGVDATGTNGATVWFAHSDGTTTRVYKSTNTGTSWDAGVATPTNLFQNKIFINQDGTTMRVFGGHTNAPPTCLGGMTSTDGGATYGAISTIFAGTTGYASCSTMASYGHRNGVAAFVVAEHDNSPQQSRLMMVKTLDYGASWSSHEIETVTGVTDGANVYVTPEGTVNVYDANTFSVCISRREGGNAANVPVATAYVTLNGGNTWNTILVGSAGSTSITPVCSFTRLDDGRWLGLWRGDGAFTIHGRLYDAGFTLLETQVPVTTGAGNFAIAAYTKPNGARAYVHHNGLNFVHTTHGVTDTVAASNTLQQRGTDIRVNYADPAQVYMLTEGTSTFVTSTAGGQSQVIRFNEALAQQGSTYQTSPCLQALLRVQSGNVNQHALAVTPEGFLMNECTRKGGNDGQGEDGWGIRAYNSALAVQFPTGGITGEYYAEVDATVRRVHASTLNEIMVLGADNRLYLVNIGGGITAPSAPLTVGVSGYGKDCALSTAAPRRVMCAGTSGLRVYDMTLAQKSEAAAGSMVAVALHQNTAYGGDGTNVKVYSINSAGALTQTGTYALAHTDGGLRLSKDGAFIMARTATQFRLAHAGNGTVVYTSPGYTEALAMDMDMRNKFLYATVLDGATPKVTRTDVAAFTSAFGDAGNAFPNSTVNPYDEIKTAFTAPPGAGSGGFVADPGQGVFGQTIDYVSNAWGIGADGVKWLLGLGILGAVVYGSWRAGFSGALVVAIVGFATIGALVALGLFPLWLLFAIIFVVLLVFSIGFFGRDDSDMGGGSQ